MVPIVNNFLLFNRITINLQDINLTNKILPILKKLQKLPKELFEDIDTILFGTFEELIERQVTSLYLEGAIYIDQSVDDPDVIFSSIVHEMAHSLEDKYSSEVYADKIFESEYLGKKQMMLSLLRSYDYEIPKEVEQTIADPSYSEIFDNFLYKNIGYMDLSKFTSGLFITPYAATSIQEYFANGVEHYFSKDTFALKKLCPRLYDTIETLLEYIRR